MWEEGHIRKCVGERDSGFTEKCGQRWRLARPGPSSGRIITGLPAENCHDGWENDNSKAGDSQQAARSVQSDVKKDRIIRETGNNQLPQKGATPHPFLPEVSKFSNRKCKLVFIRFPGGNHSVAPNQRHQ